MDELFKLLGLGPAFIYAGAMYGFFRWLDASASDEAKVAISALLKIEDYDKGKVANALVEVFDRV
jgi:hypothetical protein